MQLEKIELKSFYFSFDMEQIPPKKLLKDCKFVYILFLFFFLKLKIIFYKRGPHELAAQYGNNELAEELKKAIRKAPIPNKRRSSFIQYLFNLFKNKGPILILFFVFFCQRNFS